MSRKFDDQEYEEIDFNTSSDDDASTFAINYETIIRNNKLNKNKNRFLKSRKVVILLFIFFLFLFLFVAIGFLFLFSFIFVSKTVFKRIILINTNKVKNKPYYYPKSKNNQNINIINIFKEEEEEEENIFEELETEIRNFVCEANCVVNPNLIPSAKLYFKRFCEVDKSISGEIIITTKQYIKFGTGDLEQQHITTNTAKVKFADKYSKYLEKYCRKISDVPVVIRQYKELLKKKKMEYDGKQVCINIINIGDVYYHYLEYIQCNEVQ